MPSLNIVTSCIRVGSRSCSSTLLNLDFIAFTKRAETRESSVSAYNI